MTEQETQWRSRRTLQLLTSGVDRMDAIAQVRSEAREAPWLGDSVERAVAQAVTRERKAKEAAQREAERLRTALKSADLRQMRAVQAERAECLKACQAQASTPYPTMHEARIHADAVQRCVGAIEARSYQ